MGVKKHNREQTRARKNVLGRLDSQDAKMDHLFGMIQSVRSIQETDEKIIDTLASSTNTHRESINYLLDVEDKRLTEQSEKLLAEVRKRNDARREAREAAHAVSVWRRMTYTILVACSIIILMVILNQDAAEVKAADTAAGPAVQIIETTEERQTVTVAVEAKASLVPTNPVTTMLYVEDKDTVIEFAPQVPGQLNMAGNEQGEPVMLRVVGGGKE